MAVVWGFKGGILIGHNEHRYFKKPDLSKLWVVAVVSNPVRYKSRYRLFKKFEERIKAQGANLFICEMSFGDRAFEKKEMKPDDKWDAHWIRVLG